MPRKFENQYVQLPNGEKARIGTYIGPNGEMCVKLRLPSSHWSVTGVWRATGGAERPESKTVITLDKD